MQIKRVVLDWSGGNASVSQMDNLVRRLAIETFVEPEEVNPLGRLNTLSGVINPETGHVVPHTPDRKFTIQLPLRCDNPPVGENPRPPDCPLFSKFLERSPPRPCSERCSVGDSRVLLNH